MEEKCHAMAITVGGGACPLCDTVMTASKKGGVAKAIGCVGACKVENCRFNKSLECGANSIHVKMHDDHTECSTFQSI